VTGDLPAPDAAEPSVDDAVQARRIQEFWEASRARAGSGLLANVVVATSWVNEVPPPVWSFGDSPEVADALLALVLSGVKTGTSSALVEYEAAEEPLPVAGSLASRLDGTAEPRALIRTTAVDVVAFDEGTEEFAASEGEGARTLGVWRTEHEAFWRRTLPQLGLEFEPRMPVVCERFELLYPKG
jgi:uncharacterized protein YhfF